MTGGNPETEYLQPRRRLDGPVLLAEPDPSWPDQYAEVAARIRAALGARARLVEHVGSTAVPGLVAKPVLDVLLLVDDPAAEPAYVPDLRGAGFELVLREPGWHEHRLLCRVDPAVNLHVFRVGSEEADRTLRFRDRLRADPTDRERYATAKRALAGRSWEHLQDYADAKTAVIEDILTRA